MSKLFKILGSLIIILLIGYNGYEFRCVMEDLHFLYFVDHYSLDRKYDSQDQCQNN